MSQHENKRTNYVSIMSNCKTPRVEVAVQSLDYDVIHVGKKYPSLYHPTVYKPPSRGCGSPLYAAHTTNGE
jgi:hypothetical protein